MRTQTGHIIDERLLTIPETCEALGLNERAFYRRVQDGLLHTIRIEGRAYVPYDDVIEYLRGSAEREKAKIDAALKAVRTSKRVAAKRGKAALEAVERGSKAESAA